MWQMLSVFSHESAQRNDASYLIDENAFKTTRQFLQFQDGRPQLCVSWLKL